MICRLCIVSHLNSVEQLGYGAYGHLGAEPHGLRRGKDMDGDCWCMAVRPHVTF